MSPIVSAFQFEVRYNHILNFSQIARKILAPYVKLSQSIKIENENSLNERLILNFEEDNYIIIVSWDRILLRGQHELSSYTSKNSPIEIPFLKILNRLKELDEFGSIKNVLFAITFIGEYKIDENKLFSRFANNFLLSNTPHILENANDLAITLEDKHPTRETAISFGPYTGSAELSRRSILPVNIASLGDTDFNGLMMEYRHGYETNEVTFDDFIKLTVDAQKVFKNASKIF